MRTVLAACLCLTLVGGACAPPHARPSPTSTPVAQGTEPFTGRVRRAPATQTPVARPTQPAPTPPAVVPVVPVFADVLSALVPEEDSTYGLVLEDLASGARTAINDTTIFPSASLYKLGVAWVVLRQVDAGSITLDDPLEIEDDDAIEPEPDGGFGATDTPTIRDALEAMLTVSSNASAHALLRLVSRPAFTTEMDRIGLTATRVPDDSIAVTSASDMARLLRLIATSPDLSAASRALLADDMANVAPPDALRDALPEEVSIFDKTGNLDDASNVGALLVSQRGTAVLVVLDSGVDPGDARALIAQAGLIACRALLQ